MGIFERYLSVWVALCILAGVVLGNLFPPVFQAIAALEYGQINLVVALLIWLMIYPMMVQIDFSAIKDVGKKPKGLILTLLMNWLVKPFTMAALGWLFFKVFFAGWVDPQSANEYIAGMILLGVAPCTAMVFVWSQLTKGDANYTLVQVSVNDIIMIFAFAPLAALLLGVSDIVVPWQTLLLSVVLYVLLPLIAGVLTRKRLNQYSNAQGISQFLAKSQALVNAWFTGDSVAVIRLSSGDHCSKTADYPIDCHTFANSNLWHFCHYLCLSQKNAATP